MRYTGPVCRLCRREGKKLFLKGARCQTQKCSFLRHSEVPGKYGKNVLGKKTEYYNQLRSKQAAKRIYGLSEKQFRAVFDIANKRAGVVTANFKQILEMRFDNVIFRAGFADSRAAARQMASHNSLRINDRRAMIPSRQLKVGDKISVKKTLLDSPIFARLNKQKETVSNWLKVNFEQGEIEIVGLPEESEAEPIDAQTIIEFYSR